MSLNLNNAKPRLVMSGGHLIWVLVSRADPEQLPYSALEKEAIRLYNMGDKRRYNQFNPILAIKYRIELERFMDKISPKIEEKEEVVVEPVYQKPVFPEYFKNHTTEQMMSACFGNQIVGTHDPKYQNTHGMTVAMFLARRGDKIPPEWMHDDSIRDKNGKTLTDYINEKK